MPLVGGRRPADDATGFDVKTVHLPHEAGAVIGILQEDVALAIPIEIAGSHRMPAVGGRRPADDAAVLDLLAIHFPGEAHAIVAILEEDVALAVAIEIARPDRMPFVAGWRPADDAAGVDIEAIHLPDEALAVGSVLQVDVAMVVAVEVGFGGLDHIHYRDGHLFISGVQAIEHTNLQRIDIVLVAVGRMFEVRRVDEGHHSRFVIDLE